MTSTRMRTMTKRRHQPELRVASIGLVLGILLLTNLTMSPRAQAVTKPAALVKLADRLHSAKLCDTASYSHHRRDPFPYNTPTLLCGTRVSTRENGMIPGGLIFRLFATSAQRQKAVAFQIARDCPKTGVTPGLIE